MTGRSYGTNLEGADEKTSSRSLLESQKGKVSKTHEELPRDEKLEGEKISYGKKFAQTEERYTARQMERQLEELAREDEQRQPRREVPTFDGSRLEELTRGGPIGAMPTASEPPPRQAFSEVLGDAQRYAGMIRHALRDLTTASMRLMRLPVELAVLTAQRLRPLRS